MNKLTEFLKYNLWANRETLKKLKDEKVVPPKVWKLYSHIIASQKVWYERCAEPEGPKIQPWTLLSREEIKQLTESTNQLWESLLNSKSRDEFKEVIKYHNTKGKEFFNTLEDILIHVLNHSNYHRAQINLLLRENGFKPVVTDYIFYHRK